MSTDPTIQSLAVRLDKLEMMNYDLWARNNDLEKKTDYLEKQNDNFELKVTRVSSENQWLKAAVADLTEQVAMLSDGASDVTHEAAASPGKPDTYTQFTSFACASDVVTLSCPNNRTIFVTSAYYGMHHIACDDCCPPNPQHDCTVLIADHRPSDWLAIKTLCDNQTSCEFENFGSIIDDCEEGYTSDYGQLFYDCLPVDDVGPVGFTAWANTGVTSYVNDQCVVFDVVISNFGGHYNANTSSFICPFDGVYMVNVNAQSFWSESANVYVMRNDMILVRVWADDQSGLYSQASNTVMTECQRGELLWVKAGTSTLFATDQHSTFSAFLLHRL